MREVVVEICDQDRSSGFGGGAIAHHQPVPILVAQVRELVDVRGDLGLQRRGQHRPRAIPDDLINQ